MSSPAERSPRRFVAQGLGALLFVLVAIPGYVAMERSWRPVALRLAGSAIVIAGCMRVVRGLRRAIEVPASFALDVPPPESPAPELDGRFLRLRDDVAFSARSQRYFESILWPRLKGLAGDDLSLPAASRGRRRGPSFQTLESLIAAIERRG